MNAMRTAKVIQFNEGGYITWRGTAEIDGHTIAIGGMLDTLRPTGRTNLPEGWPIYTCGIFIGELAVEPPPEEDAA